MTTVGEVWWFFWQDLFAIAQDQPFRFPSTFTFVIRAFSTLEGSLSLSLSLWLHYQYLKCVYLILIYWKWNSTQLSGTKPIILFSSKEVSELLWCFALSWLTIFAYRYRIHPWSRFFLRKDCCAICTGSIPSPNNYNSHPYS